MACSAAATQKSSARNDSEGMATAIGQASSDVNGYATIGEAKGSAIKEASQTTSVAISNAYNTAPIIT
jgi:hypothetical protein